MGNVGVGTMYPTAQFHMQGTGVIRPVFETVSAGSYIHDRPILDFKKSNGTISSRLPVGFNDKLGTVYFWGYDGTNYIESSGFGAVVEDAVTTGVVKTGMYFSTNDGNDQVYNYPKLKMYLTAEGNLLINPKVDFEGNLEPGSVTGDGKLQVRGNIRAQEIKVEIANWPDYVFAKDYQLPSLEETEKHIKEKGHLQGMPTAREVEANGVYLGDLNAKLLKKIEELTLHLIYESKKNTETQSKLRDQENKIEMLTELILRSQL
jgi:hypothetical protein